MLTLLADSGPDILDEEELIQAFADTKTFAATLESNVAAHEEAEAELERKAEALEAAEDLRVDEVVDPLGIGFPSDLGVQGLPPLGAAVLGETCLGEHVGDVLEEQT